MEGYARTNGVCYSPGMAQKLSWSEIEKLFDKEWVELIEYDWPEGQAYPKAGIVRVHAKTRKEFDQLILQDPPDDSALIFVGKPQLPPGVVLSANLHRPVPTDA